MNHDAHITADQFNMLSERDLLLSDWQQDWRSHWKTVHVDGQPVTFSYHLDIDARLEEQRVDAPEELLPRAQALMAEYLRVTGLHPQTA